MKVPFESVPVNEAQPGEDLTARVEALISADLPAFVIHSVQSTTENFILDNRVFGDLGFISSGETGILGTRNIGFHTDSCSDYETTHRTRLSVHRTLQGVGIARLFPIADPKYFANRATLPLDTEELIKRGEVDDTVLDPVCYETEFKKDTILVFRIAGKKFLAHDFVSITPDRESVAVVVQHIS